MIKSEIQYPGRKRELPLIVPVGLSDPKTVLEPLDGLVLNTGDPDPEL